MSRFNWAPTAFRMLNGVFCIFKPDGLSLHRAIAGIQMNLAKDLNALPCYMHEIPLSQTRIRENTEETAVSVDSEPSSIVDWSEHRLVLGDRYEQTDFEINCEDGMSTNTSGVLVLGIGQFGKESVDMIAQSKFLRVYHVKGRLGYATDNFTPTGHFLERTSFKHVSRAKLDKMCAAAQAAHTRQMYRLHGVHPDSQEAYEMAAAGLVRPAHRDSEPILYGVKCIDFQPPDFTLEIHCINETSNYLRSLVHDMAIKLKSTAVCTGIRCLRYGYFDLKRALLRQHWRLDNIVENIESNVDLLAPKRLFVGTQAEKVTLLPYVKRQLLPDKKPEIGDGSGASDKQGLIRDNKHTLREDSKEPFLDENRNTVLEENKPSLLEEKKQLLSRENKKT